MKKKLLTRKLKKSTLEKLIKDTCMKTAFSHNNKVYKQIDSVSMGSSLGPILANIIMMKLEEIVVSDLINSSLIKFYIKYVDDTLLLAKENEIANIVQFNAFDGYLKSIKTTHRGQYIDFTSQIPWKLKTKWVKMLYHRANKICSSKRSFLMVRLQYLCHGMVTLPMFLIPYFNA